MNESERVPAARITDNANGQTYELDFCRESVVFAERRGFKLDDVADFPVTGVSDLFFYAFRMHHKSVAREKTDKLMERMGGLSEGLVKRLMILFNQAQTANTIQDDETAAKNSEVTVEL